MANLVESQIQSQPTDGKYFKSGLGPSVFYGTKELKRKEAIATLEYKNADVGALEECSLDVTEYIRSVPETQSRFNGGKYDDRETLSGVYQGSVLEQMNVGRQWDVSLPSIAIYNGVSWGDHMIKTADAFSSMALAVPQAGSFSSFSSLQALLGNSNMQVPMELMGAVRMMDQTASNSVRFLWRLALLYVAAKIRDNRGGGMLTVTNISDVDFVNVETVDHFTGVLQGAVSGTNYVPFIAHNLPVLQSRQVGLLLTACSNRISIDERQVVAWPAIQGLSFLYHGSNARVVPVLQFHASEVWQTAVAWATQYSDVKILHECVNAIVALGLRDNQNMCLTNLDKVQIELPVAKMQPLAMALILEPCSVEAHDLYEPVFTQVIEQQLCMMQLMGVLYWYWVWHGPVFYDRMKLLENSDEHAMEVVLVGARGPRVIWGLVQHMLTSLGVKGKIGRIMSTVQHTRDWKRFVKYAKMKRRSAVQWEELACKIPKISKESALWGTLYPLQLEKKYITGQWGSVGHIAGSRDIAECMYSVLTARTVYKLQIHKGDGTVSVLDYVPDVNYAGRIADYQFFTTNDKWGRMYTPIFQMNDKEYYHMLVQPDAVRFHMNWYIDRVAAQSVGVNVSYSSAPREPNNLPAMTMDEVNDMMDGDFGPDVAPPDNTLPEAESDEEDWFTTEDLAENATRNISQHIRPNLDSVGVARTMVNKTYSEHGPLPAVVKKILDALDSPQEWKTRQLVDAITDVNIIDGLRQLPESKRAQTAYNLAQCLKGVMPMAYSPSAARKLVKTTVGLQNASSCLFRHGALSASELPETLQSLHQELRQQQLAAWQKDVLAKRSQGLPPPPQPEVQRVYSAEGITDAALSAAVSMGIDAQCLVKVAKTGRIKDLLQDAFVAQNDMYQNTHHSADIRQFTEDLGGAVPAGYTEEEWEMLTATLNALDGGAADAAGADAMNEGNEPIRHDDPNLQGVPSGSGTQQPSGTEPGNTQRTTSTEPITILNPGTASVETQNTQQDNTSMNTSAAGRSGQQTQNTTSAVSGLNIQGFTFSDLNNGADGSQH